MPEISLWGRGGVGTAIEHGVSPSRSESPPGKRECRVGQYIVDLTSFEQWALPVLWNVSICGRLISGSGCVLLLQGGQLDILV